MSAADASEPEVLTSGGGLASAIAVESGFELGELDVAVARGYWEQVWTRFKRDRLAVASGLFIVFLLLVGFVGAPLASALLGHGPDDQFAGGVDSKTLLPVGPMTHVSLAPYPGAPGHFGSTLFVLGADGQLGRDEFLRLLYGAQTSLEVAVGATVIAITLAVLTGSIAGYFGGGIDMFISRLTEIALVFPITLFVIALAGTAGPRLNSVTLGVFAPGVVMLTLVIGLLTWAFSARVIRAQVLSLREKEFMEAARMVGASDWRIIRSHLLPHLVAPIIVLSTIAVAGYIILEASLSFLGLGIQEPAPSWGKLLSSATDYYLTQPWLMVWPGIALLLATLAFNLLGDGLRDAFDPRSSR
jgi:peptide/nickel transport system permease protein